MSFKKEHEALVNDVCKALEKDNTYFTNLIVNYTIEPIKNFPAYRLTIGTRTDDGPVMQRFVSSREAAFDYIRDNQLEIYATLLEHMTDKYDELEEAFPEVSKGVTAHWIFNVNQDDETQTYRSGTWRCSNCSTAANSRTDSSYPSLVQYCSQCGAHMIEKPVIEVDNYKAYKWE